MDFIWMIIIGGVAGMVAGMITKGKGFGILMDIGLGICGAVLAGWLFGFLGIAFAGLIGKFVAALVGSLIILFIVKKLKS